jgi:tetratricopeptide (TPR) repeat protein
VWAHGANTRVGIPTAKHASLWSAGFVGFVILSILPCSPVTAAAETFASLSARANAARDTEHLEEAAQLYRRALALRPSWKDGWWSLGTIYYDQDSYAKAAHAFRSLVKADPKNGSGYAMLGLCEFELGQDAASLQSIQTGLSLGLIKDQSLRNVVLYHEGLLLLRKGQFTGAGDALALLASYGEGGNQAALALGMAALRILPHDLPPEESQERGVVLRAGRAEILAAQKKFDDGAKIYAQLIANAPQFPGIHCAYGKYLLQEHLTDEAVAEFQQEIKNNPRHVQSYLEIAAVQYHVDSAAGAQYAEEAVRLQPTLPFAHYLLGLLYADSGDYEKAITQLELAERSHIHEADLYYALSRAYSRTGRKADATRARATFLQLSSQSSGPEPNIYGEHRPTRVPDANYPTSAGEAPPQR